jgi:thimet oligopeptidase
MSERSRLFDYRTLTPSDLGRRVDAAVLAADALVMGAVAAAADPSPRFDDVLGRIDGALANLSDEQGRTAFLVSVHPDSNVRDQAQAARERIEAWVRALPQRDDVAEAVGRYATAADARSLDGEERRLLDRWQRDLRRAGHGLSPEARADVRALTAREVELEGAFLRNIDEWTGGVDATDEDLAGMPEAYVSALRPGSAQRTRRITVDYPELWPFLESSPNRQLREELLRLHYSRAMDTNRPLLEELLATRRRHAAILGYPSWAHYRIEPKMARSPERVEALLASVIPALRERADREYAAMAAMLARDTGDSRLQRWDWYYYREQIRAAASGADPGTMSEYLPLEVVLEGLFDLTREVFGILVRELPDARAWADEVRLFELLDSGDGSRLGWCYADLHPREGKFGHAMVCPLALPRRDDAGEREPAVAALVVNVPRPSGESPACLRHDDVEMLFHEFGHVLHVVTGTGRFHALSMDGVEQDFQEAVSQIMENWAWEPDILCRISRHHRTGERMPAAVAEAFAGTRTTNVGSRYLRWYVGFATFDQLVHGSEGVDLDEAVRRADAVEGLPSVPGTFWPAGFGHIAEAYDAGYYGYLWSRAYGDDMWSRFAVEGITDGAVGRAYRREVLEPGASRDAEVLVESFLGRPFSSRALLERAGLDATPVG